METLFIFLVKSSGVTGMFYMSYYFLLRKETFFNSNRWFLLAGLISSVLLPLVVFKKIVWVDPSPTDFDWSKFPPTTTIENDAFEINWYFVFAIVYSIGIVMFLIKFTFDFYSLSKILKGKTIQRQADFKFIDVSENIAPFSYFNYIVYNSSLYSTTELENILEHEKVHSEQNHTVDVLISRFFCIVFWFNPVVWLYKKAIVQNLEFIADSEASKNISDKKAYQLTLIKITTQENCVAITNHFYQSLIKKRIVILNKNQSKKWNSWKYAVVLPALVSFVLLFQVNLVAQEKATPKQENEVNEAVDLTTFKIEKDLTPLSKGKEIYIDGEKSSEEELAKLDPSEIKNIDVIKKSDNSTIVVTTKHASNQLTKSIKLTDKDIYIDGVKSTNEEFNKLDKNAIDKVDVNTYENTVRITTKNSDKSNSKPNINDVKLMGYVSSNSNEGIKNPGTGTVPKEKKISQIPDDSEIYIDEKKVSRSELEKLDPSKIKSIDVTKGKTNIISVATKEETKNNSGWAVSYGLSNPSAGLKPIIEDKNLDYKKAVIIIDGKISDYKSIDNLDPKNIISVDCSSKIKDLSEPKKTEMVSKYGEKVLNGLIEIKTKSN